MWSPSIPKLQVPQLLAGNNRKLTITALVFLGFVCADLLLYSFLLSPAAARLRGMEARAAELRHRHAEAGVVRAPRTLFAGLMAGIPAQKDMPILVKDLVQTARQHGLSVASITYDMPSRAGGELALLKFSFPAEGKYADVKRFIYNVETSDRLVGIQEMKLGSDKGRVNMEMKLVTYIKSR